MTIQVHKIMPGQMRRLNQLLNQANLQEHKQDMVQKFSARNATSSKDLLKPEAEELINHLEAYVEQLPSKPKGTEKDQSADKMRKKMIHYAYEMRWTRPDGKCDMKRLNGWCQHYGQFNKQLNAHSYLELTKLVTQFEEVYESFLLGIVKF